MGPPRIGSAPPSLAGPTHGRHAKKVWLRLPPRYRRYTTSAHYILCCRLANPCPTWYMCSMPHRWRRGKGPPDVAPIGQPFPTASRRGKGNTYPSQAQPTRDTGRGDRRVKLLPGGFAQLLPIVQWIVGVHLEHIEEAARGTLASGTGGPSEEVALECLLRILEGRHEEADKETLEAYTRARTWEWWQDFHERRLLTDMVRRADQRKKKIGSEYSRRPRFLARASGLPG